MTQADSPDQLNRGMEELLEQVPGHIREHAANLGKSLVGLAMLKIYEQTPGKLLTLDTQGQETMAQLMRDQIPAMLEQARAFKLEQSSNIPLLVEALSATLSAPVIKWLRHST